MAREKYNFSAIEIGQSAEYEGERGRISACVCQYGKRHGRKYSTKIIEGKVIVTRVS